METEFLIIGAGVAGLACAQELHRRGHACVVLEKARGVGGRCATRRVQDQPVDFGVTFFHGSDPDFLTAVRQVDGATVLPGWPMRRAGAGQPCQPEAFYPNERRIAIAEGLSAFPKSLARGVDVHLRTRVTSLALDGDHILAQTDGGETWAARDLVVAVPLEQSFDLIQPLLPASDEMRAMGRLLQMLASVPCLTVLAGYPLEVAALAWDVCYPEDSEALLLLSNDSAKRASPRFLSLVLQARPRWSHAHLEQDSQAWAPAMLAEAARILGPWASSPIWTQAHCWRYARVDRGSELAQPVLVSLPPGCRVGLAGDVFAPGGGIQAAWLSGRHLARRFLGRRQAP